LSYGGQYLDGDNDGPFVWLVEGEVSPADIRDIYWSLPDQVVASSGSPVMNESVTVGADSVDIMVVPESGRWAQRSEFGIYEMFSVGDFFGAVWEGDLTVAVLLADLSNPVLTEYGAGSDDENLISDGEISVPMSSRPIGDYGQETAAAALGADGSALVVAPVPEALAAGADGSGGEIEYAQTVIDTRGKLQVSYDMAQEGGWQSVELPQSTSMAGAVLAKGSVTDPKAKVLPTLLFEGERGPEWSGPNQRAEVEVDGTTINVAIEPNLQVWAASCNFPFPGVGRVASTEITLVRCADPDADDLQLEGFAVVVLPTDDASSVEVVARDSRQELVEAMGDPVVADIGDGLSMWVLPLGLDEAGSGSRITKPIEGIDIDGDGKADTSIPTN